MFGYRRLSTDENSLPPFLAVPRYLGGDMRTALKRFVDGAFIRDFHEFLRGFIVYRRADGDDAGEMVDLAA